MQGLGDDECLHILHEAGATGKSTRSFRLPPMLRPAAKAPPAPQPRRWRAIRGTAKKGRQDLGPISLRADKTWSPAMAIKYGRPIEARLAPVETRPVKRLDLTTRPRRNR